ncbi:hypothetical protein GCM10022224_078190 [Nonomuraea antimicrobica]|uniref:Transposase n=1 Tax=Nonomuraea antimicrobica TaxID=561173 RepID=A0ABP7D8B9_9ACTN
MRRKFTAPAADVLRCGDVTQIDTDEGKLYLATVEDLFSRRLLGYAHVRTSRRRADLRLTADGGGHPGR